ncbi:MAG: glycosyltransferase [Bacteroidaceae bacterium]|nr:glycosyltransferase [Bacteroidaceae bacterium]
MTISIVMCTCNGANYVREQIDSLLRQTCPATEIIIQDDGSTDHTWQILTEYAQAHPQIRLFHNTGRRGINGNFMSALRKAKGDFIAVCDQDDIWVDDKLQIQLEAIGSQLMCGGLSRPFSSDGFPVKGDDRVPCLHALRLCYLSEVPGHVQFFRRELLDYLPPVGRVTMLYDWQLQFIAAAAERLTFTDRVLVHHRRHAKAATATVPVENKGKAGWKTFWFLFTNYAPLNGFFKQRLQQIDTLLSDLERLNAPLFSNESVKLVRKLIELEHKRSFLGYLRLTFFCMAHHDKLYHAPEPKKWKSVLRAAYYPMYGLYYYRHIMAEE